MGAEFGDVVVTVVSALSDRSLHTFRLPHSSSVLQVKQRVQAEDGLGIFCQRLIGPAGEPLDDREALAILAHRPCGATDAAEGALKLVLVKLAYADDPGLARRLLCAARDGEADELERLLKLPVRPDCYEEIEGRATTSLLLASEEGHLEVVRLLCEAGADKDKADEGGFTPLFAASLEGHLEVVRLLCEVGADKDKADQGGSTPLFTVSVQGQLEMVRLLCEAGADKDKVQGNGATALMAASHAGHPEVERLLGEARHINQSDHPLRLSYFR